MSPVDARWPSGPSPPGLPLTPTYPLIEAEVVARVVAFLRSMASDAQTGGYYSDAVEAEFAKREDGE